MTFKCFAVKPATYTIYAYLPSSLQYMNCHINLYLRVMLNEKAKKTTNEIAAQQRDVKRRKL